MVCYIIATQSVFTTAWELLVAPVAAWQAAIAASAAILQIYSLYWRDEVCNIQIESFIASLTHNTVISSITASLLYLRWYLLPTIPVTGWTAQSHVAGLAVAVGSEPSRKDGFILSVFLAFKRSSLLKPNPKALVQSSFRLNISEGLGTTGQKRSHSRDRLAAPVAARQCRYSGYRNQRGIKALKCVFSAEQDT